MSRGDAGEVRVQAGERLAGRAPARVRVSVSGRPSAWIAT
jgi:hypothetical protein